MTDQPDYSGVAEVPVSEAAERLPGLVDKVLADDLFVYLTQDGKRVAVIMPSDIGEGYERADDEYWTRRYDKARSRLG
jgi:PHD/YefM family antitoxin component YafN of YafNO toxin-antitoxin module